MTPALRRYRPQDRAACKRVVHEAVHEGAKSYYSEAQRTVWSPSPDPDPDVPDKLLDQICWVAEDNSGIVGLMSLRPDGYLDMAFVLPQMMGTGLSARLYEKIETQARALGLDRMTVHASHLARPFFEKQGWQVDAAEAHPKGGQVFDRFCMSRDL